MEEVEVKKIAQNAINQSLEYLRQASGSDLNVEKLGEYMNVGQVTGKVNEIVFSEEFGKASNPAEFLREGIVKYFKENLPFNDSGKRIFEGLEGGLEGIAKKGMFTREKTVQKRVGEYLSSKQTAGELAKQVVENSPLYAENPELVAAAQGVYSEEGKGALIEINRGLGRINEEYFTAKKLGGYERFRNFIDLSDSHMAKVDKYAAAIIGIFGVGLIISSGFRLTGNVVGESFGFGSGLIGALVVSLALGLFFMRK